MSSRHYIRLGKNVLKKPLSVVLKKKICLIRQLAESFFLLAERIGFIRPLHDNQQEKNINKATNHLCINI